MDSVDDTGLQTIQFHEMGLDDRILKAIAHLGWAEPTLIQEKAIPLALEGKDILSRARTGSGKTAAYAIPVIQRILSSKQKDKKQSIKALILVPSRELSKQAYDNVLELSSCCTCDVRCVDVSGQVDLAAQRPLLMENPDIVIGTPSRIMAHLHAKNLSLKSLEMLVVDEADLIFSFGHEDDLRTLVRHLPKIYQAMLMSATLADDVTALKQLVLHNPVMLKLEESQLPDSDKLSQYHIKCQEDDKFLLLYCLFKLKLVRGKSLIFVNNSDRCYRIKLFLEQFSIPSCVLNSELPVNSRCHIVTQFNTGLYDIIIASEELRNEPDSRKSSRGQRSGRKQKDKDYGVSRGIDFQNVSNVINFDFPATVKSYIHRVGRSVNEKVSHTAFQSVLVIRNDRMIDLPLQPQRHFSF